MESDSEVIFLGFGNSSNSNNLNQCTVQSIDQGSVQNSSEMDFDSIKPPLSALIRVVSKTENKDFKEILLEKSEITIGRDQDCDFIFNNRMEISNKHAKIVYNNEMWYISNLSDPDNLFVDGKPVNSQIPLVDNCIVSFASMSNIHFRYVFVQDYTEYKQLLKIGPNHEILIKPPYKGYDQKLILLKRISGLQVQMNKLKCSFYSERKAIEKKIKSFHRHKRADRILTKFKSVFETDYSVTPVANPLKRPRLEPNDHIEKFKEIMKTELECMVCACPYFSPIIFNCNHVLCNICYKSSSLSSLACPYCCMEPISSTFFKEFNNFFEQYQRCLFNQEEWIERLEEIKNKERQYEQMRNNRNN